MSRSNAAPGVNLQLVVGRQLASRELLGSGRDTAHGARPAQRHGDINTCNTMHGVRMVGTKLCEHTEQQRARLQWPRGGVNKHDGTARHTRTLADLLAVNCIRIHHSSYQLSYTCTHHPRCSPVIEARRRCSCCVVRKRGTIHPW